MNTSTQLHLVPNTANSIHGAAVQVGIEQIKVIYQQFCDSNNLHMEWDLDEIQHTHTFELLERAPGECTVGVWVCQYRTGQICLDDHSAIQQLQDVITEANKLLGHNVIPFMQQNRDFAQLGNPISKNVVLPPVVQTHSGIMFNLLHPDASMINIDDIAHALSNLCRFNGHTTQFYSVAQHCVLVSHLVPSYLALAALMHDASEAYMGDCISPLKQMLPEYKKIENGIMQTLFNHLSLDYPLHSEIKRADIRALATEKRDLMQTPNEPKYWSSLDSITPSDVLTLPMDPQQAKQAFLDRYFELQAQRLNAQAKA